MTAKRARSVLTVLILVQVALGGLLVVHSMSIRATDWGGKTSKEVVQELRSQIRSDDRKCALAVSFAENQLVKVEAAKELVVAQSELFVLVGVGLWYLAGGTYLARRSVS